MEADLALATKLVYMVLLDRARLSQANGWADSSNQIYIVFPIVEIANAIDRSPIIFQTNYVILIQIFPKFLILRNLSSCKL